MHTKNRACSLALVAFAAGAAMTGPVIASPPADLQVPALAASHVERLDPATLQIARDGLRALQIGAATGKWASFEAMLAEDVTFYAPVEGFDGLRRSKAEAHRLFVHHAEYTRTRWTLMRTIANGNEIGFEVRAEGAISGRANDYANNLFMLLRIEGGKIVQFREYAATTGYVGHEIGRGAFDYLQATAPR